jgi:hypothetical protein
MMVCRRPLLRFRPHRLSASPAIEIRRALLDSHQRDKEQTDVMIHLLPVGLVQAASRAALRRMIYNSRLGLNACNENTHSATSGSGRSYP